MLFCSKYYDGGKLSPTDPANDFIAVLGKAPAQNDPDSPAAALSAVFFGSQTAPEAVRIADAEDVTCIAASQYIDNGDEQHDELIDEKFVIMSTGDGMLSAAYVKSYAQSDVTELGNTYTDTNPFSSDPVIALGSRYGTVIQGDDLEVPV